MNIRTATFADRDLLVNLGRRTFQDAFAGDSDPADMAQYLAEAFSPQRIGTELSTPGSVFLLAYPAADFEGAPLGYARLQANSTEPCIAGPRPIELVRLYLEQTAIGNGYGSRLMRGCLDYAANGNFGTIWLGVWEHNYQAQQFYQRWGFHPVGTHDFPVGQDIQTDWIMVRPVESKVA